MGMEMNRTQYKNTNNYIPLTSHRPPNTRFRIGIDPTVKLYLGLDMDYRTKTSHGALPIEMCDDGRAMPVMHTKYARWEEITVSFSNSDAAKRARKTDDWVVIRLKSKNKSRTVTVVTDFIPPLKGKRIVRGMEMACTKYYKEIGTI